MPIAPRRWLTAPIFSLCLGAVAAFAKADGPTLPSVPQGSFSIVVIPDTQAYRLTPDPQNPAGEKIVSNRIFDAHTRWIAENLERQSIAFVSHAGDIVDKNEDGQWKVAQQAMNRLHGKVPYGLSVGNHDMTRRGDSTLFQKYFPAARFADFAWYGGAYAPANDDTQISGNNANSFQLFSTHGLDFVFLHLECNAPDDVLAWADQVLEKHQDRLALITTHMCLGPRDRPQSADDYFDSPKGRMRWSKMHGERGNSAEAMWNKCFRKHPNLFMVCCGDQSRTQAWHLISTGDHGNRVHQLLCDYSTGWLRTYHFHPTERRVEAWTFRPDDETLCQGARYAPNVDRHQFEFELPSRFAPLP
ncbi:MAG: metallophosphoesterase [Blastopirellula sp. JB062]